MNRKAKPILKGSLQIPTIDIANWFLGKVDREAGDLITHLKLQKLVYYAQAWALVLLEQPLFSEDFEAWAHGPVLPSVYQKFSHYKGIPIPMPEDTPTFNSDDVDWVLSETFRVYGYLTAKYLEELTHREEPWLEARGDLPLEAACSTPLAR